VDQTPTTLIHGELNDPPHAGALFIGFTRSHDNRCTVFSPKAPKKEQATVKSTLARTRYLPGAGHMVSPSYSVTLSLWRHKRAADSSAQAMAERPALFSSALLEELGLEPTKPLPLAKLQNAMDALNGDWIGTDRCPSPWQLEYVS
jgi:hypothetical protein